MQFVFSFDLNGDSGLFPPTAPQPVTSTPSDDNANDGFSLDYSSGKTANQKTAQSSMESESLTGNEFTASETEIQDVSPEVNQATKRQKIKTELSMAELYESDITKLVCAANSIWASTNHKGRVSREQVTVGRNAKTGALSAKIGCLLCTTLITCNKPDYSFQVQNYRRHVTQVHKPKNQLKGGSKVAKSEQLKIQDSFAKTAAGGKRNNRSREVDDEEQIDLTSTEKAFERDDDQDGDSTGGKVIEIQENLEAYEIIYEILAPQPVQF